MTDKFRKITIIIKIVAIIKVPANIYDDCLIIYKQVMTLKDKPKWLIVI